jgi:hypothetical protein
MYLLECILTSTSRIQQQITGLTGEKRGLQQQLLGLQKRITELQTQVGN